MHRSLVSLMLAGSVLAACATPTSAPKAYPDDPRSGLTSGLTDAGIAAWNMKRIQALPSPPGFYDPEAVWRRPGAGGSFSPILFANTDMAFQGDRVLMGSFHGFNVFEKESDGQLDHVLSIVCPGGQGDVSIHGDLVFMSTEQNRGRLDCGGSGIEDKVSADRFRGVRIFDLSNMDAPRQIAAIQTCRGSHTHTLVPHPNDDNILYVYNQGTSGIRPGEELPGCQGGDDNETALYSIDIIEVPLDRPQDAKIINRPRIFADRVTGEINGLWKGGTLSEGAQKTSATNHCHDIAVYPELNLAAGACSGNGILLDITSPASPFRISELSDPNMAYWHSAVFNNDGTKVVYADEWGGGLSPRCQVDDPRKWGANVITDITEDGLKVRSHYKIPTVQSENQNCVSHNGNLIPVPGRDIKVQGWYQGGISVIDFTDSANPMEIAYFDQGPIDDGRMVLAGYWSAYWYNGHIYGSEIVRGLDVFALTPSEHLSANEIAAAQQMQVNVSNPQTQVSFKWPAHPSVARAYLDQIKRAETIDEELERRIDRHLQDWERGRPRADEFAKLADDLRQQAMEAAEDTERLNALADQISGARPGK